MGTLIQIGLLFLIARLVDDPRYTVYTTYYAVAIFALAIVKGLLRDHRARIARRDG